MLTGLYSMRLALQMISWRVALAGMQCVPAQLDHVAASHGDWRSRRKTARERQNIFKAAHGVTMQPAQPADI